MENITGKTGSKDPQESRCYLIKKMKNHSKFSEWACDQIRMTLF